MDPSSGQILAMANWPTFNPNVFQRASAEARRNRAIQDLYEPGSTFKIVTASAALQEHVVQPDDPIDVSAGLIRFGSRQIDDDHRYGVLTFTDVIVKSSNVGTIKVGLKLGAERLDRYARRFGFGEPLSPDFRGESPGIVWSPAHLDDSALASMCMGYQVAVTPLQMAAAASAVANGGELVEPRVVRAVIRDGRRLEVPRKVLDRAITPETAATLTTIMEQVVDHGTGTRAQVPGYHVAGKTGTSHKLVDGRYSNTDYNASFVGFVPSRRPALTIVVVIDSPRKNGYYAATVAAPIFARVAEASLRHLGIPPTINPLPPVLVARAMEPDVPVPQPVRMPAVLSRVAGPVAGHGLMPDLRGLSAREALRALAELGLGVRLVGDGLVADQEPAAGTPLDRGGSVTLRLERRASRRGGPMTLRELVRALDAPARQAAAALGDAVLSREASAVAYDSRRRRARRGLRRVARAQGRRRGASPSRPSRGARSRSSRSRRGRPGSTCPGSRCRTRARRSRTWPPRSTATPPASSTSSASRARTARPPRATC